MEPAAHLVRDANIPCNVVAAAFHDHLFVLADLAELALGCLHTLQRQADERCLVSRSSWFDDPEDNGQRKLLLPPF